ncbi:MAG: hypothetical protein LBS74_06420 [Oscillospiraceae bacterium]|jgi:succinate dehydrogenase/fumarate reductase cytochrome b subunit|nr:hypothetical protein [Oscillospiraceae bacterium]
MLRLTNCKWLKRATAVALCVLFISAVFFSAACIFTGLNHTHDHNLPDGGCAACAQIAAAGSFLKQICAAGAVGIAAFGLVLGFVRLLELTCHTLAFCSPVRLKVKLNN